MLRINKDDKRTGWDGIERTWDDIEKAFETAWKGDIVKAIKSRIRNAKRAGNTDREAFWQWCLTEVEGGLLIAKPEKLRDITDVVDGNYKDLLSRNKYRLRNDVWKVFGYKHYKLIDLACWLNVKTCPYCNMQYTLYLHGQTKKSKMAKFQFDHFYDKAEYPMLSMSLYNLIPSCASCNQGKSKGKLGLEFHPYHAAIKDTFHFEVEKPVPLWEGSDAAVPEIKMVANAGYNLQKYQKMFHTERLYQHHKDEARDTFTRAYADSYYSYRRNFDFLTDKQLARRIWMGFYPDEEDIDKRPLTKLKQDLWKQAKGIDWKDE